MGEFGLAAPIGRNGLQALIEIIGKEADQRVPEGARGCLVMLIVELRLMNAPILEADRRIMASAQSTETGRRLMGAPGAGLLLASALVATIPDPHAFRSGSSLAAWIGVLPKQNPSRGKNRLGGISKQGDRYLPQMLVVGALAAIRHAEQHESRQPWLMHVIARIPTKVAAVAVANKMARVIWATMTSSQSYREPRVAIA